MTARNDIKLFVKRLKNFTADAAGKKVMEKLGKMAVTIIVRRTRLGGGVSKSGGKRYSLKSRYKRKSKDYNYTEIRKQYKLGEFTKAAKRNLTFSGQMLDNMEVIRHSKYTAVIGPTGRRPGERIGNAKLAEILHDRKGPGYGPWPFNFLSKPEESQLTRFYRRKFGDLVKRKLNKR